MVYIGSRENFSRTSESSQCQHWENRQKKGGFLRGIFQVQGAPRGKLSIRMESDSDSDNSKGVSRKEGTTLLPRFTKEGNVYWREREKEAVFVEVGSHDLTSHRVYTSEAEGQERERS